MQRTFEIITPIRNAEVIASGRAVRDRRRLWRLYGYGNWRKMKGIAGVLYADGTRCLAELHWYEAHGVGRRDWKVKEDLRLL